MWTAGDDCSVGAVPVQWDSAGRCGIMGRMAKWGLSWPREAWRGPVCGCPMQPMRLTELIDPEVLQKIQDSFAAATKLHVLTRDAAARALRAARRRRETVVFTNGCFDLLHRGHVQYLGQAKALGDILVVGLNSDDSVRQLKGPERPLNAQEDRAQVLAALEVVDYVCLFGEQTPAQLIAAVVPDVLVKGGDYRTEEIVGRDTVQAAGGQVVVVEQLAGFSTQEIIERIRQRYC